MEVLKKTQGIDTRAKGSILRGKATITLKDATTGRITEQVEHKNFFTSALDSAFNGCPFGLDSYGKSAVAINSYPNTNDYRMTPITDILLGGVMCFPESLGDSLDDYYPSLADNPPTAYASKASYQITDSKQGTFDGVASGDLANGYRFVYNWGSSGGNGRISSVALSHRDCYMYYTDAQEMLFPHCKRDGVDQGRGFTGDFALRTAGAYTNAVAMSNKTALFVDLDGYMRKVMCYDITPFNINMKRNYSVGFNRASDTTLWTFDTSSIVNFAVSWQYHEGYYWGVIKSANGASAVKIVKIDEISGETTTSDYTWNTPQATNSNNAHFAIKDGYLYMSATVAGKIYKCSLSNVADVTEISCSSVANEAIYTSDFHDNIYGRNFLINNDVVVNHTAVNQNIGGINGSNQIIYHNGVWVVSTSQVRSYLHMAQILAPYCATKNNLESPITKTADKQMVITYTVTQE